MLSLFFIKRPIFATVISVFIVLVGLITIPLLPVERTPDITPPTVNVSAKYPGANAKVVDETVAVPLEQQINGVEDMIYMSSKSSDDGSMNMTVNFDVGTDIDMATVLVQNRVSLAEPVLPEEVKREGISVQKQSTNMTLVITLQSPDNTFDEIFISNYININLKDAIQRVPGVGAISIFGAKDYGMRIWLDPRKLKSKQITTEDVINAIKEQNIQVAAGTIGAPPSPPGQQFQFAINTLGRLDNVEQFKNIIVKTGEDGRILRIKDIASVELGSQTYATLAQLNASPAIGIGVYQLPGANAMDVAQRIKQEIDRLSKDFPKGLEYAIPYDTTIFIAKSIREVIITLFIAVILVIFTVYIFLQDFRTTLIPSITIPVSLIGTCAIMKTMGISINTLSLFGLVLAIGIVVDDSIVVVENTMRLIDQEKLSAKEAAAKAMSQITGPVIATTLVLLAVFVPTAMIPGITGRMYQQFALTISVATVFSTINALTMSPALCGMLLRPSTVHESFIFKSFNRWFEYSTLRYVESVKGCLSSLRVVLLAFIALVALTFWGVMNWPTGFIPDEDEGILFISIELPDGATIERSSDIVDEINKSITQIPEVENFIVFTGYSLLTGIQSTNTASIIITLKDWDERKEKTQTVFAISKLLQQKLLEIQQANCFAFIPPPIPGLGNAGGFEMQLQDRGSAGYELLEMIGEDLVYKGNIDPALTRMNNSFRASVPQLYLEVDREKAKKLGLSLNSVFGTLQAYLGSIYVNDFNLFGRTFKVMIQAQDKFRRVSDDVLNLEVRNSSQNMIPMRTFVKIENTAGPVTVFRYNMYPSATITGQSETGFSSGQAINEMQLLCSQTLPPNMDYEWSGITYQQLKAGNIAPFIFGLALIFVFLFLSAQYESWSIPLAIILSVPLAILGAFAANYLRDFDNNIYTQIGFVLLIGLSSKSAILIVEFAKQLHEQGLSIYDAAIEASKLRFRPILMTAFSFILGVLPLVVASGAGAVSRKSLGTTVFGGTLAATIIGIFLIPSLYAAVQSAKEKITKKT